jgi:hypothetical protein
MRLLLVGILTLTLAGFRGAAAQSLPALPGTTWHSKSIDGSALLFVVERIGIHLGTDGTFTAKARLVDGQTLEKHGTYAIDPGGYVTMSVPGFGRPQRVRYYGEGQNLVAQDAGFGVSLRFLPGPMEQESWF